MKRVLLAAVAVSAMMAATPALAGRNHGPSLDVDVDYNNKLDTQITTDVTYTKDVALRGTVTLSGAIEPDSSAVAVNDVKQISGLNTVLYREENELNAENGYVDPVYGPGYSEPGYNGPGQNNGVPETRIRAGFFAPIINTVAGFNVTGEGNIGVNLAAGYFNMQANSAVLASSDTGEDSAGWAEASTTSLQVLGGVSQAGTPSDVLPEDNEDEGGGGNNFRDRNTVAGGTVGGAGNIGVNAAAGSLNQQANLMTLAVATNSVLAEANAGLVQLAVFNGIEQQDSINSVGSLTLANASGNIGVNMAAGVGNQQLNALTIATSLAGGAPTNPGGGGGGSDPS